jgi:hypothetical protein
MDQQVRRIGNAESGILCSCAPRCVGRSIAIKNDISTHFQKLVEAADALANDGEKNDLLSDIIGAIEKQRTLLKQAAKERRFPSLLRSLQIHGDFGKG